MIYSRFGSEVTIVRVGTLEDVEALDNRKPDQVDRDAIDAESYVVTRYVDDGTERLTHLAYLRADNGIAEIQDAIEALD